MSFVLVELLVELNGKLHKFLGIAILLGELKMTQQHDQIFLKFKFDSTVRDRHDTSGFQMKEMYNLKEQTTCLPDMETTFYESWKTISIFLVSRIKFSLIGLFPKNLRSFLFGSNGNHQYFCIPN